MEGAILDRQSNPESVRGYAFYDWGKSAFETSVTTAVLPAWFAYLFLKANGLEAEILGRNMTSDAVWSVAVAIGAVSWRYRRQASDQDVVAKNPDISGSRSNHRPCVFSII